MKTVFLFAVLLINITCVPFKDSPFSDHVRTDAFDLNNAAIVKLNNVESDGEFKIALFADSHTNDHDLDIVIQQINQVSNLDFVVNLGDFTDSSYNFEYDRFVDSIEVLQAPSFTVIGNHDALGAGPVLFKKIFGLSNYWFETASARFIFFHTASLEDPKGFDPQWLLDAVASSAKNTYIFSHISLVDDERFAASLFQPALLNPLVKMSIFGHKHVYIQTSVSGTILLQVPRVQRLQWLILRIAGNNIEITRMPSGEIISTTLKP